MTTKVNAINAAQLNAALAEIAGASAAANTAYTISLDADLALAASLAPISLRAGSSLTLVRFTGDATLWTTDAAIDLDIQNFSIGSRIVLRALPFDPDGKASVADGTLTVTGFGESVTLPDLKNLFNFQRVKYQDATALEGIPRATLSSAARFFDVPGSIYADDFTTFANARLNTA